MVIHNPENYIEALIFASERSIGTDEIQMVLAEIMEEVPSPEKIEGIIEGIHLKYHESDLAIELVEINGGYQFLTRKEYHPVINQLQIQRSRKKLSQAALETLSIIAYKQPITKVEIEQIRGVNCDYTIQKLLEKELINITGKAETVGKPLIYATSTLFMDYFGINSKNDLPNLNEILPESNTIGEQTE